METWTATLEAVLPLPQSRVIMDGRLVHPRLFHDLNLNYCLTDIHPFIHSRIKPSVCQKLCQEVEIQR